MKVIAQKPPENTILANEIKGQKGLVVSVYDNKVSFLTPYRHPSSKEESAPDFAFWEAGEISNAFHSATYGRNNLIDRKMRENDNEEIHFFPTLKEFCDVALENGWDLF